MLMAVLHTTTSHLFPNFWYNILDTILMYYNKGASFDTRGMGVSVCGCTIYF